MDVRGNWSSWGVAAVAFVAGGAAFVLGAMISRPELAELRKELAESKQKVAALEGEHRLVVTQFTERIADLEDQLAASTPPQASAAVGAEAPDDAMAESFMEQMAAFLKSGERTQSSGESKPSFPFLDMFNGEQGEKMAELSAQMAVDMQYRDLFSELGLFPEAEQQVREILARNLREEMLASMKMLKGGVDTDALEKGHDESQARLRKELSQVLSREGLAIWDEYQETLPQRMMAQSLEMQLNMFAKELTPENRELAVQVMTEEVMALQTPGRSYPFGPDAGNAFTGHVEALHRARERLATSFDEDQLAYFDRFVEQQERLMEMSREMFGTMFVQAEQTDQQEKK